MVILGVDQSYTKCGLVVVERRDDDNDYVLYAEVYGTELNNNRYKRAFLVAEHVSAVAQQYNATIIVEGLAFGTTGNATRDLAGLLFTIITYARYIKNQSVYVVTPKEVKKLATGKGTAKKPEMFTALAENVQKYFINLGAKKTTGLYDLADAFWIAKIGIKRLLENTVRLVD